MKSARLALLGILLIIAGVSIYLLGIVVSVFRVAWPWGHLEPVVMSLLWWSGFPVTVGLALILIDLLVLLPKKRQYSRLQDAPDPMPRKVAVALTAYNDEKSIASAVQDFLSHPLVSRLIVVDNNSRDRTVEQAKLAGAEVVVETKPGYGRCVYRCFQELAACEEEYVVLCEGDMTFRARDLEKLVAFAPHADVVNGTRIVEQLRAYDTQLSTFMFYGNFFVGKLLEVKHIGRGTFTDVGTTYKLIRRRIMPELLEGLNPAINLEFNAHFLDRCLSMGYHMVECPVTFHARLGVSKGGNVNNFRALAVGGRMILGLLLDWRFAPKDTLSTSGVPARSTSL
jgi:hypothetical protein